MPRQTQAIRERVLGNGCGLNMTNEIDRDNEDWLQAIAGDPRPGADKFTNAQAEAVRNALVRRSAELDKEVPEASDAAYHRLLFRLKREGLLKPRAKQASNQASFFSKPLAIAAVFFLGASPQKFGLAG